MPYKISGTLQETADLYIINTASHSLELSSASVPAGDFEIEVRYANNYLNKLVVAMRSDGKTVGYGQVMPTYSGISFNNVINVPGDYSTVQDGIDAASDGDLIYLGDGTRTYETINYNKWVHLKAMDRTVGSTILRNTAGDDVINFNPSSRNWDGPIVIEGIRFWVNHNTNYRNVVRFNGSTNLGSKVYFNKCSFELEDKDQSSFNGNDLNATTEFEFRNCTMEKGRAQFFNMPRYWRVLASEMKLGPEGSDWDENVHVSNSNWSAIEFDVVVGSASNYGYQSGEWLLFNP